MNEQLQIPEDLRERMDGILLAASENGGEFASDEDVEAFRLIERVSRLEAQNGRLSEALEAIIKRVALISPYYEMARAALAPHQSLESTQPKGKK